MGLLKLADYTGFVCSDEMVIGAVAKAIQIEPRARLSRRFVLTGRRARVRRFIKV